MVYEGHDDGHDPGIRKDTGDAPRAGSSTARGESINEVAEKAVELFRRQQLLETTNAAYAALRHDPDAWQKLKAERATLEGTLADGLEAY